LVDLKKIEVMQSGIEESDVLVEGKKVIIVSMLTGHAKLQKTYVMIPVE